MKGGGEAGDRRKRGEVSERGRESWGQEEEGRSK